MSNGNPSITQPLANMKAWSGNKIASTSNLASRKIYMQVGSADTTVGPNVMAQLKSTACIFYPSSEYDVCDHQRRRTHLPNGHGWHW